ncbi:MAG: caspase family protein [Rhizobiales bacterium]|nr:caspase family protein [Hyphomicrobiales bacterium]
MKIRNFRVSRRTATLFAVMIGTLSLAIGAHAALYKRAADATKAAAVAPVAVNGPTKVALVIGNSLYPDANAPLAQPANDARALAATLQRDGFDVETVENADKSEERLRAKIRPDSVAMLFFSGFGVQVGRESYMIPVDAAIWKASDVRRDGTSIESVLAAMKERGARAKLVVVDASRRNPYERRFRSYSHGLAPINAPDNALVLSSAAPGQVVDDGNGQNSPVVAELLNNLKSPSADAATVFNKTRTAVSQASNGKQVPSVSSSLLDDVNFGDTKPANLAKAGS